MACWEGPEKTGICIKCGDESIHTERLHDGICNDCIIASIPSSILNIIGDRIVTGFFYELNKKVGVLKPLSFCKNTIHNLECRLEHMTYKISKTYGKNRL